MKTDIIKLLDFERINTLLEGFNKTTGFVTAILDLEGNVLSKSGWRNICADFHRVNALTAKKCTISDTELANKMAEGEKYHFYKCLNGLVDVAVPLVIDGEHVANLFSGQFFFEEPDRDLFVKQAKKYNFDNEKYMKALADVPVFSKDQVKPAMDFLLNMANLIADMALQRMEQIHLNEEIKKNQLQLKAQNEELHKAKVKAEKNEEKYRLLFNNNPQPMWVYDVETLNFLEVNNVAILKYGYSRAEFLKMNLTDIRPAAEVKKLMDNVSHNFDSFSYSGKWIHKNKNGDTFTVEIISHSIVYNNQIARLVLVNDITDRKQAEATLIESEKKYRALFENMTAGFVLFEAVLNHKGIPVDLIIVAANKGFELTTGLNTQEVMGKRLTHVLPGIEKDPANWIGIYGEVALTGKPHQFEQSSELLGKYYAVNAFRSAPMQCAVTFSDVTERKLAEKAKQKSEEQYRTLFETMTQGVVYQNAVGEIISANPAAEKILGLSIDQMKGRKSVDPRWKAVDQNRNTLPGEKHPAMRALQTGKEVINFTQGIFNPKENNYVWILVNSIPQFRNGEKMPYQVFSTFLDITEQKNANEEQIRLLNIIERSRNEIFVIDEKTLHFVFVNLGALDNLGYSLEEMKNMTPIDINPEFNKKLYLEILKPLTNGSKERVVFESFHQRKNGSAYPVEIYLQLQKYDNKSVLLAIINDITDRKKAEKEIENSNLELQTIARILSTTTGITDPKELLGKILDEALKIVGLEGGTICLLEPDNTLKLVVEREATDETIHDLTTNKIKIGECLCGNCAIDLCPLILNDREAVLNYATREALRGDDIRFHAAFPFTLKDRCLGVLCLFSRAEKKPGERKLKLVETLTKQVALAIENAKLFEESKNRIADLQRAEIKLKESQIYNRRLFKQSPIGLALTSMDGKLLDINPAFATIIGRTVKETKKLTYWEITPEKYARQEQKQLESLANTGSYGPYEKEYIHKNGHLVPVNLQGLILEREGKKYIWSSVEDISEQKRNRQLIQSERDFSKALLDGLPGIFYFYDDQFNFLRWNKNFEKISGYTADEIAQMSPLDFFAEDEKDLVKNRIGAVFTEGYSHVEADFMSKDGTRTPYFFNGFKFKHNGKDCLIGIGIDIAERKKAEEKLKESETRFRKIFEDGATGMVLVGNDFKFRMANQTFCKMTGYSEEELLQLTFAEISHPDDSTKDIQHIKKLTEGKIDVYKTEKRYLKKDGQIFWAQLTISSIADSKGEFLYYVAIIIDITERKQAEQDLMEVSRIMKDAQEIAHLGSFEYVAATQTTIWSEEEFRIYGLDPNGPSPEYNVMLEKCFHPDDAKLLHEFFMAAMQNQGAYELEHRIVLPDGSVRWVFEKAHPFFDEKGRLLRYAGATLDITERKKAEAAVLESEELLRLSTELANVAAWEYNFETDAMSRSKNHDSLYGLEHQKVWSMGTFINATHPNDRNLSAELIQKSVAINGPDEYKFDFRVIYPNQSVHWLNVIGKVVKRNEKREGIIVRGFLIDITDRKNAEIALQTSKEYAESLIQTANVIVVGLNTEGKIVVMNQAAEQITGYTFDELKDGNWFEILVPKNIYPEVWDSFLNYSSTGDETIKTFENPILTKSGIERYISWQNGILREGDQISGTISFGIDITEQKQAEKELKESEERLKRLNEELEQRILDRTKELRDLYDNAPCGYHSLDKDGLILQINDTELNMLGYSRKEVIHKMKIMEIITPESLEKFKVNFSLFKKEGFLKDFEIDFIKKDQTILPILLSATAIYDADKNFLMSRSTLIDNTDLKQAKDEILKAKTTLEAANKELETFTYSVSHDLKAPLRGIDGYSELLSNLYGDQLNAEAKHFISTIRSSTLQMNQLIEDLLKYSRLERSQQQIRPVKIKSVIASILKLNESEILTHHFSIKVNVPDIKLYADLNGIQIALRNLIENAIKFTKKTVNPKILIKLAENQDCWIISVSDNGIGFNMKYNERIFEIFQRLQRAEDYPGTGIGLAMTAKAMQRMNGKVRAESIPGKGSTFYLEISKNNQLWN